MEGLLLLHLNFGKPLPYILDEWYNQEIPHHSSSLTALFKRELYPGAIFMYRMAITTDHLRQAELCQKIYRHRLIEEEAI